MSTPTKPGRMKDRAALRAATAGETASGRGARVIARTAGWVVPVWAPGAAPPPCGSVLAPGSRASVVVVVADLTAVVVGVVPVAAGGVVVVVVVGMATGIGTVIGVGGNVTGGGGGT